jgi:serine phosphatase RsbU (regulator of sigma subunit)
MRFFVDQLGFDLTFDAHIQSGERWVAVAPPDGGALLALVTPKPHSPEHKLIGRHTGVVFVTEDVVAKYGEWRKRGVRFQNTPRLRRVKYERPGEEEEEHAWGGIFTRFKDPDGNSFALVGFDEFNRELEAQRRGAEARLAAERRAAQELEIAKEVQGRLFPQATVPMLNLDYAGRCIQARHVGGDYFDFIALGVDRFALVIGDIAGKGMAAALLMANLQANLRVLCAVALDRPQALLCAVNQAFHRNTHESAYATLFFAEYDDAARTLRYANCGHLPALLLRGGGAVERLESTGTVLGLFPEWECTAEERILEPGDVLAVYTDGITESFNAAEEDFGEQRLTEALRRHQRLPANHMIEAVVEEVLRFSAQEQQDDITLTVAKCR